ncbi:Alpha-(1,4)-fucosyltransferase-like protein [Drosera capensis]
MPVLGGDPDELVFETTTPPSRRHVGDTLRAYMDLEAGRRRIFSLAIMPEMMCRPLMQEHFFTIIEIITYHLDILVYWSSSRCLAERNDLAKRLRLLSHRSFGKCLNNVGGLDMALSVYPKCTNGDYSAPKWRDLLHCAMSHYKFILAIENTKTESYFTEKLFYALDTGAVPIYFGAPNVWDFVPPHSIIDESKFSSLDELASYVKSLANNPVAYAEYHAWRRCGILGEYGKILAANLDTLPCRLCEAVSRMGGRRESFLIRWLIHWVPSTIL